MEQTAVESQGLLNEIISGVATLFQLGGPVVAILVTASVFGLALALVKFIQFSGVGRVTMERLDAAIDGWQGGDQRKAIKILEELNTDNKKWYFFNSRVALAADIRFGLEAKPDQDPDLLHDELMRRAAAFLRDYSRNLRPLELIYYLAPVLGLLGTVLGMIDAFKGLAVSAGATGESSALASGIWEALLTTAVGLSIAIPFAVMHALLESRLEFLADQVTDLVTRIMTMEKSS